MQNIEHWLKRKAPIFRPKMAEIASTAISQANKCLIFKKFAPSTTLHAIGRGQ
jgi:hypothetical protein